ncbi:ParB/RepB/Spo0J family partition protein [Granulicella cerasi]|uniref:ParB/RepB/Spo0J family partition protein n=1 Tax=Granulicella cerasi TaxID=741063 RepID=A0ABW1ZBM0_9BACT|nr:ParB/RepB/Spo0J family partition protein [Granulicella cerasi]
MSTADKKRGLGRGLESLLPGRPTPSVPSSVVTTAKAEPEAAPKAEITGKPLEIAVELIDRNPFQTRTQFDEEKLDELAKSITASGVVQPIVVRLSDKHKEDGRYVLITGERRWLASKKAGKATVPAMVREVSNVQAMEMTIVENLQRADLNPMEQAHAYARLSREFHMTQEQMAERTGQSRASVANFLRLLKLPQAVQMLVEAGSLTFGHARALLALENAEAIEKAASKVMALNLSVRSTESMVQGIIHPELKPEKEEKPKQPVDPNVRDAQDQLRRSLGLRVQIEDKNGKGRVIIEYTGVDDFDAILSALGNK